MKPLLTTVLLALAVCSCSKGPSAAPPAPRASSSAVASAPPPSSFAEAELRRDPGLVTDDDLHAQDARRREAAVRSLARVQDEKSFQALSQALADEEPAVVAWAAFGIGRSCKTHEPDAVRRLVLRAATLGAAGGNAPRDAVSAIALALGRCGNDEAERSLRAWLRLGPEVAEAAALGLGKLASQRRRLDDASIAALLDAAAKHGSPSYFFPIERLPALGAAARQRLLEVSKSVLDKPGPARAFAARALARGGAEAAPALRALIESADATDAERANAAQSLGALGAAAQPELGKALAARARLLIDQKAWLTSQHGVVVALLDALEPHGADPTTLAELSRLPLEGEPPPVVRRKVMLRCRAAALLAGRASASQNLLACDPSPPAERREGSLALLRVLGRSSLAKGRGASFRELCGSKDRVVREAALELLMSHDEVAEIPALLASALDSPDAGVRATAALVLSRYPARAQAGDKAQEGSRPPDDPRLVQTLTRQLSNLERSNDIELSSLLLDAASALQLLGAKPALEKACASSNPTLREHAERGLIALGDVKRRCPNVPSTEKTPLPAPGKVKLDFETDLGPLSLSLDGDASPFAVARIVELARSGFYDGMPVHRVVPGFVVQFGDPDGDSFGGPNLPPLRCQLGPQPFDLGSVGVALSGRDTGSSQLFIALRRIPHLDGEYSLIGQASPGWDKLAPGDRLIKAHVVELPR